MIDYPITRTSTNTTSSYWEPAWLNNTGLGSACQDAILFEPDCPNVTAYSRKSVNLFNV
jgi:arabinogalactan endo-1,4-beta-galactosidase